MINTAKDLLGQKIAFVTECKECYYVRLKGSDEGNTIWKVDKKTFDVTYDMFTRYIVEVDRVEALKPIEINEFIDFVKEKCNLGLI